MAALAKLRYVDAAVVPYAAVGPHLDVFLGGRPDEERTLAYAYSSLPFGGTVGIGVEAGKILPVHLFVELRYSFDVTNSLPDVPRDANNNAFDWMLGIRL